MITTILALLSVTDCMNRVTDGDFATKHITICHDADTDVITMDTGNFAAEWPPSWPRTVSLARSGDVYEASVPPTSIAADQYYHKDDALVTTLPWSLDAMRIVPNTVYCVMKFNSTCDEFHPRTILEGARMMARVTNLNATMEWVALETLIPDDAYETMAYQTLFEIMLYLATTDKYRELAAATGFVGVDSDEKVLDANKPVRITRFVERLYFQFTNNNRRLLLYEDGAFKHFVYELCDTCDGIVYEELTTDGGVDTLFSPVGATVDRAQIRLITPGSMVGGSFHVRFLNAGLIGVESANYPELLPDASGYVKMTDLGHTETTAPWKTVNTIECVSPTHTCHELKGMYKDGGCCVASRTAV